MEKPPAPVEKPAKPAAPPEPAPPTPPTARESESAPEPPAPAAPKVKETAAPTPEPPPPTRFTEASKGPAKTPEPVAEAPAPVARAAAPASPAPAAAPPSPAALGFGGNPPEKAAGAPDSDSKGEGGSEISTVRDYRRFLAKEMKAGAPEGQYVPNLRFGDNKAQENREIMKYFGMELIAYPKNQKFYVYIDPEQGLFSRSNDFTYIHNFSSRVIFRNSPYFDALRAEAAKRVGLDASSLVMAQLLKPSSAAYIGWKERESARRAGVALEDVEACDATFAKTPFGVWIVRIDRLLMRDGRTITVQDFEWGKVSGGKGGDS
jgi:hypothetical protein